MPRWDDSERTATAVGCEVDVGEVLGRRLDVVVVGLSVASVDPGDVVEVAPAGVVVVVVDEVDEVDESDRAIRTAALSARGRCDVDVALIAHMW